MDVETCPCGLCGKPTRMLGTKRCDGCWELEKRIHGDPALALRILAAMVPDMALIKAIPPPPAHLPDILAMDAITHVLSGNNWDDATLDEVVQLIRATGRTIEDVV
ncbi:MAG: hypothetical protein V4641_05790 [Pseudomonadota bacterium]